LIVSRIECCLAWAAVIIAIALSFSNGSFNWYALGAMTIAAALGLWAALAGRRRPAEAVPASAVSASSSPERRLWQQPALVLWLGLLASTVLHLFVKPTIFGYNQLQLFHPLDLVALVMALAYLWRGAPDWFARLRFALFIAMAAVIAGEVIIKVPQPGIDVWDIQQIAADAIAKGLNPYGIDYPNSYGPGTKYLQTWALSPDGWRVIWNPYAPLPLLLNVPAMRLLHDVRWTSIVCTTFAAWGIWRLGKKTVTAELAAVLLLFQPRAFMLVEKSWTDPMTLATLVLALLAVERWRVRDAAATLAGRAPDPSGWILTGLASALLCGSKQYSPLVFVPLFFAMPARGRGKAAALAVAGAVAVMLPFYLGNPRGFINGVVIFQTKTPFRADALSWPAAVVKLGGPRLLPWPAFVLVVGTLVLTLRKRISSAHAMAAAAAALMLLLLPNKQAFLNYYWLAVGLFVTATALYAGRRVEPAAAKVAPPAPALP
jgi:hypothetical protein